MPPVKMTWPPSPPRRPSARAKWSSPSPTMRRTASGPRQDGRPDPMRASCPCIVRRRSCGRRSRRRRLVAGVSRRRPDAVMTDVHVTLSELRVLGLETIAENAETAISRALRSSAARCSRSAASMLRCRRIETVPPRTAKARGRAEVHVIHDHRRAWVTRRRAKRGEASATLVLRRSHHRAFERASSRGLQGDDENAIERRSPARHGGNTIVIARFGAGRPAQPCLVRSLTSTRGTPRPSDAQRRPSCNAPVRRWPPVTLRAGADRPRACRAARWPERLSTQNPQSRSSSTPRTGPSGDDRTLPANDSTTARLKLGVRALHHHACILIALTCRRRERTYRV